MDYRKVDIPADLIQKCVKCGLCKSVCPSYYGEEGSFARGRLALAEMVVKEEISLSKEISEQWEKCAMCRRCEWICPNGVNYKEILISAKALKKEKLGSDLISKLGLKSLELMQTPAGKKALKILGFAGRLLPSQIKTPLPTGGVKFLPKPYKNPFSLRGKVFGRNNKKGRLLFFTGCMIDIFHGKTGDSVVKLMETLGYEIFIPKDIRCCGAPHLYHGDLESFDRLRDHNLKEMKRYEFDAIVVACPTCGGALEEDYGEKWKVYDFSQLIMRERGSLSFKSSKAKVTFHVPCHSYTAMKIDPETFYATIAQVSGVKIIRAELAQSCCGFAGLWSIKNPSLAEKVQREKMKDFAYTEADIILSTCPGCILQLSDGVRKFRNKQKVKHLADFLAEMLNI